jgi:hypothetical protein
MGRANLFKTGLVANMEMALDSVLVAFWKVAFLNSLEMLATV